MSAIVCVFDTAARVYGTPFFVKSPAQAVRSLRDEVNSKEPSSDIARHPSDFELYELGSFDEDTGMLLPNSPTLICRSKDLKESVS